jgi:hypothetical protein
VWRGWGGHCAGAKYFPAKDVPFETSGWMEGPREVRTQGLMKDLCLFELGQEAIGAFSFSWGSARFKNDVGASSAVGLGEAQSEPVGFAAEHCYSLS